MKNPLIAAGRIGLVLLLTLFSVQARELLVSAGVDYYATNYASGNGPSGLWLSNFRGLKTWRDILMSNRSDNTVSILFCGDDGTFSALTTYAVGLEPIGVF